jgi:RNA recognition motif-containing protein
MPSASTSATQSEVDTSEFTNNNSSNNTIPNQSHRKEKLFSSFTSKTNLYIRGLNEDTSDKDLYEMCKKYGEIKSTKAIIEKQTNKCKGYGFVDYKLSEDAKVALGELKKEQKDVQLAKQREQDPTNLYFANLPADIDEKWLNEMLKSKFTANVNSTRIMKDRNGNSKGVGFARIDDNKLCDVIIQELNGKSYPDHSNKTKCLLVKLADSGGNFKANKQHKSNSSKDSYLMGNSSFGTSSNGNLSISNDFQSNHHSQQQQQHPPLPLAPQQQQQHHQHQQSHYNLNHCQIATDQPFNYNGYPIQFYDPSQTQMYHIGSSQQQHQQSPLTPQTPTSQPIIQQHQGSYANIRPAPAPPVTPHHHHHHHQYMQAAASQPPAPPHLSSHPPHHHLPHMHHHHHHNNNTNHPNPYQAQTPPTTNGYPSSYYYQQHPHPQHPHYVVMLPNQTPPFYSTNQHYMHQQQHPSSSSVPMMTQATAPSATNTNTTTETTPVSIKSSSSLESASSQTQQTPNTKPDNSTSTPSSTNNISSIHPTNLSQQLANMSISNQQYTNNSNMTSQKSKVHFHSSNNSVHVMPQTVPVACGAAEQFSQQQ